MFDRCCIDYVCIDYKEVTLDCRILEFRKGTLYLRNLVNYWSLKSNDQYFISYIWRGKVTRWLANNIDGKSGDVSLYQSKNDLYSDIYILYKK